MSKTKLRVLKYSFFSLAWLSLFAPLVTIICLNFDTYFVQKDGLTVATGGILAIFYVALLVKIGFKKISKTVWAWCAVVIVFCLESILKDALNITIAFSVGVTLFELFEKPARYYAKRLDTFDDEQTRMYVRTMPSKKEEKGGGRV